MKLSELDNLEDVPMIDARALEEEVDTHNAQIEELGGQLRGLVATEVVSYHIVMPPEL